MSGTFCMPWALSVKGIRGLASATSQTWSSGLVVTGCHWQTGISDLWYPRTTESESDLTGLRRPCAGSEALGRSVTSWQAQVRSSIQNIGSLVCWSPVSSHASWFSQILDCRFDLKMIELWDFIQWGSGVDPENLTDTVGSDYSAPLFTADKFSSVQLNYYF